MKNNYIAAILVVAAIVAAAAITYSIVKKENNNSGAGSGNNSSGSGSGAGNNSATGPRQNPNTFTPRGSASSSRLALNPLALGNSGKNFSLPGTVKNTLKRI